MAAKALGILILFLTALYYSQSHQVAAKRSCDILSELCSLFSYILKNIECFTRPLDEICQGYSSPLLEQCGFFLHWQNRDLHRAVQSVPYLPESVQRLLFRYADTAGQGYKEEEVQLCRYTWEQLSELFHIQKEELKAKNKMYRTLPFLLVLSIVLLFY